VSYICVCTISQRHDVVVIFMFKLSFHNSRVAFFIIFDCDMVFAFQLFLGDRH